jgi:PAS domain S-box-containing protein
MGITRQLRYVLLTALGVFLGMVAIVLVGLVISLKDLRVQEEQKNLAVSHALSFAYGADIYNLLTDKGGVSRLETALQQQLIKTSSLKVNLFDTKGVTVFSTDKAAIGELEATNSNLKKALAGSTSSEYEAFEVGAGDVRRVAAVYLPIFEYELVKGGSNRVMGVFEVYSDVTSQVRALYLTHAGLALTATLMLGLLFGGIYYTMRRSGLALQKHQDELERYALIVKQTPTVFMEVDKAGQPLYLNPSSTKHFPELSVNAPAQHPLLASWESITKHLGSGSTFEREVSVGNRIYLQKIFQNQQSQHYDMYAYDLTQQKRTEADLLKAQREQQALLDAIPDMMFVTDKDGTLLECKVDDKHGDVRQLLGHNFKDLGIIPDGIAQTFEVIGQTALAKQQVQYLEYDLLNAANQRTFYEARLIPLGGERVMSLVRDVTERKVQDLALRESEAKNRSLLAALPDLIFVIRKDGIMLEAQLDKDHPPLEPIVGRNISDLSFIPRDISEAIKACAVTTLETGQSQLLEYPMLSESGLSEFEAQFVALDHERVLYVVRDITKRKVQERALRESEARNRSLIGAFPDLIFVVDKNGTFLEAQVDDEHPLMEPLVGRTFSEVSFIPEETAQMLRGYVRRALTTRTLQLAEYSLPSLGRISDYEARFVAIDDERVLYIARDVSERKRREEALRESEAQVRSLLESIPDMVFVMSKSGTYLDFKLDKTHGLIEDLVGRNVKDLTFMPPGIASSIVAKLELASQTSETQTLEYALDGNIQGVRKLAHYEARFTRIDEQKVLMFVRDVTKRYENEWALQASEAQVRSLLEAIPDMVFVMGRDGTYLDFKLDKSHQLLEELVGRNVRDLGFMTPNVVEGLLARLELASKTHEVQTLEYSLDGYFGDSDFDGGHRLTHYEARFAPIDHEKILMVVRDVTKRHTDELSLQTLTNEAQRRAQELLLLDRVRSVGVQELEQASVISKAVEVIAETFDYTLVSIYLLGADQQELVMKHQVGYKTFLERLPVSQGVMGKVARTGQAVLLKNPQDDPDVIWAFEGINSEICVPLLDSGKVVGVLNLESTEQRFFDEADFRLMTALSETLGVAIERARLYQETKASEARLRELYSTSKIQAEELSRQTDELELLEHVRTLISNKTELGTLFKTVTEVVAEFLGYELVGITLVQDGQLVMQHQLGYSQMLASFPAHLGVEGRVIRNKRAELVADVTRDPDYIEFEPNTRSEICVPLFEKGEVVGVLIVESVQQTLYEQDLHILTRLGAYVSLAMEQAQLYEELQQSEVRYRDLIENATDIIYRIDLNGTFTYTNAVVKHLMDYDEEEVIGKNYLDLVRSDERGKVQAFYIQQLRNNELTSYLEFPAVAKDGREVWIGQSVGLVKDDGRITGMQAVARDITERKRMEEALVQQAEELSSANADLEQFAFIAAHDLQEPLRKIQAFGDRLNLKYKDVLDETGRDYLERMRGSATRMRTLIDDLLAFARSNKQQNRSLVSLEPIIRGVLSDLQVRIEETEATVSVGTMPTLEVDPSQMRQVFQNLIGNALKFRRPGVPPVITVYSHRLHTGDWQVRVSDNGIGFEEQYNERIFAVFQRLHSREQYEGTGIGLAIVRRITEGHGGSIEVSSRLGEGTTFYITLPGVAKIRTEDTPDAVLA